MIYALGGILLGVMLGTLTVAAIIPAVLLIFVVAGTVTAIGGEMFGPNALEFALLVVALQVGYLIGAAFRSSTYREEGHRFVGYSSSNRPVSK